MGRGNITDDRLVRQAAAKGSEAEERLKFLSPYFETIEKNLFEVFKSSKPEDIDGRERCYMQARAIKLLEQELTKEINLGKVAGKKLEG